MTDRELLELAAKAAGYEFFIARPKTHGIYREMILADGGEWNPLTDDGDALRLAVKLNLVVSPYIYFDDRCQLSAIAKQRGISGSSDMIEKSIGRFPEYSESHVEHDPYAATRRAIVRAAAEIGKGMK